jgi:hypothetical protein
MAMEKYAPNRARFFVRTKYATFSTERIVALRLSTTFSRRATISQLRRDVSYIFSWYEEFFKDKFRILYCSNINTIHIGLDSIVVLEFDCNA